LAKAPAEVVNKEREKLEGYREKALKLKERLEALKG
jgi:valyl-tRNA synthetase